MERIGLRELRQHASRYLARVAEGEVVEVTDRGRPVARLVPIRSDTWSDLVATGRVVVDPDQTDVTDEAPRDYYVDASRALIDQRAAER